MLLLPFHFNLLAKILKEVLFPSFLAFSLFSVLSTHPWRDMWEHGVHPVLCPKASFTEILTRIIHSTISCQKTTVHVQFFQSGHCQVGLSSFQTVLGTAGTWDILHLHDYKIASWNIMFIRFQSRPLVTSDNLWPSLKQQQHFPNMTNLYIKFEECPLMLLHEGTEYKIK